MNTTIISPVISEQSMDLAAKGKYTFSVGRSITKTDVKKVIEARFKVNVTGIRTSLIKGRAKKVGARRMEAVSTPFKKAVVSLKEGQKIDMFDIGGQE